MMSLSERKCECKCKFRRPEYVCTGNKRTDGATVTDRERGDRREEINIEFERFMAFPEREKLWTFPEWAWVLDAG